MSAKLLGFQYIDIAILSKKYSHMGYFRVCHTEMHQYFKCTLWYCSSKFQVISRDSLTPEDIGVDTRIVILCQLELDISVK